MIVAYIIAGVFAGYHFLSCVGMLGNRGVQIPVGASLMMAFVGGVAGHLCWTLLIK